MCQPFVSTKTILMHHFYILQPINTIADSFYSKRSKTPIFLNLQSFSSTLSIAQQSADTTSIQIKRDDELPRTFKKLPRITINTKNGRKEFVETKHLNTLTTRRS